jgi:HSP20 family molecular chaperone IbpA
MKKENYFESDSPLIEMETQNYRPGQTGPQIPFVSGITGVPYSGFAVNSIPTPYSQQPTYGNYNGLNSQQNNPVFYHPGSMQQQTPYSFQQNYMQPVGNVPAGYPVHNIQPPTQFPTQQHSNYPTNAWPQTQVPFATNQNALPFQPQAVNYPLTQQYYGNGNPSLQTPYSPNQFAQPLAGQTANYPSTQAYYGNLNPTQQTPYYQPAINIVDGQQMMVPNQYTPGQTKNGNSVLKNGERDFISWFPNVNILETDRFFKIEVCVPGVSKENCRIHVDKNNILRISGTRRWNQETDAVAFTKKEFNYGSFACSFLLTENMLKEKITSSCHNGLLIVSIPKREGHELGDSTIYDISVN